MYCKMKKSANRALCIMHCALVMALCAIATSCENVDPSLDPNYENGVSEDERLCGVFNVSKKTQVQFSQGNLIVALHSCPIFADNQWDLPSICPSDGKGNDVQATFQFFQWGKPDPIVEPDSLTSEFEDWGMYNWNTGCGWRTLSADEWRYLFAHNKYYYARVCGQSGLIIFPARNKWPKDITCNKKTKEFSDNELTEEEWNVLQSHGAVFLPASGECLDVEEKDGIYYQRVVGDYNWGYYWTSTLASESPNGNCAYCVKFPNSYGHDMIDEKFVTALLSVRLVTEVKKK